VTCSSSKKPGRRQAGNNFFQELAGMVTGESRKAFGKAVGRSAW